MLTLGELRTEFASTLVKRELTSGSRLGLWVYWVWTDILASANYWWNRGNDSLTTVSGTAEYFLSNRVSMDNVWGMFDTTNDRPLHKIDLENIYHEDPTPTETGTPAFWAYVDQSEVGAIAASASTISLVSSSASDTSQTVLVRGKVSGLDRYATTTLNGTTPAAIATPTWDAGKIESVSLSAAAVGVVTATSATVSVAIIPPGHLRVSRPRIRMWHVPGGAYTIPYFFYKNAVRLVNDYEIVDLPNEAFKALRCGIEEIGHASNQKMNASLQAHKFYVEAKEELISWSDRDTAGNPIKAIRDKGPFGYRLPDLINGTVTA